MRRQELGIALRVPHTPWKASSSEEAVVRYPPEKTTQTWVQANRKKYKPAGDYLGRLGSQCSPKPLQDELLSTKTISWVNIFQLARTIGQKRNYKIQKARLVHLETFLELHGLG